MRTGRVCPEAQSNGLYLYRACFRFIRQRYCCRWIRGNSEESFFAIQAAGRNKRNSRQRKPFAKIPPQSDKRIRHAREDGRSRRRYAQHTLRS